MSPRFTSPPDPMGFNIQVWNIVRNIPAGKVATYGQIASLIGPPSGIDSGSYKSSSPRWVGSAMAKCPDDVPWQRVINAQGKISSRRSGGQFKQKELLEDEGILFDDRGRIDLKEYGWSDTENVDRTSWRQSSFEDIQ